MCVFLSSAPDNIKLSIEYSIILSIPGDSGKRFSDIEESTRSQQNPIEAKSQTKTIATDTAQKE